MKATDISKDILENIFVTAIEGGSNYWYFINEENHAKIRGAVTPEQERAFSMAIFKAVFEHNVSIDIQDVENTEDTLGTISLPLIYERLNELLKDDGLKWALLAEIDEQGDAETSDIVFQYITMGEVPFS